MFRKLLQRLRPAEMHHAVYEQIVAQARQPSFYARLGVPDTVDGRFDMIVVHLVVILRAMRRQGAGQPAQGLVDRFFKDMELSLREMGVSDVAIPKRMKQVIRAFYGRAAAYEKALEAGDSAVLSAALQRNILGGGENAAQAAALARYILDSDQLMEAANLDELETGRFAWARDAARTPTCAGP